MSNKYKTIVVSTVNYQKLAALGRTPESFNSVISKLLQAAVSAPKTALAKEKIA